MPKPKPPYPAAFRQQMVKLVRAGRGVSDLAREFSCNAGSIHAWIKAAGGLDGNGATSIDAPLSMNERQESALGSREATMASIVGALEIGGRLVFAAYCAEDAGLPIKPRYRTR